MQLKKKLGLAAIAIAWVGLPALGAHFLFGANQPVSQIRGSGKVHAQIAQTTPGSLGGAREAELLRVTRDYVKAHPEAPAAMAEGKELAPAEFINEQLSASGAKWRVRKVHGRQAEIYDVS